MNALSANSPSSHTPLRIDPDTDALLVIDIQPDFIDGALAVPEAVEIMAGLDELAARFRTVVATQDWHPKGHASFASSHGMKPFTNITMPYGEQTLWPDHCIQGTPGAELALPKNILHRACAVVRKGMNPSIDSYSAFFENDRTTSTGLAGMLADRGVKRVFCVGLAYDFCVAFSARDAVACGFEAIILKDHTRAISEETAMQAERAFDEEGVVVTTTDKVFGHRHSRSASVATIHPKRNQ